MAFQGSAADAMAFFDLSGSETLRIDEFLFGVEFFVSGSRLKECLMLFQELDVNGDGMIDEAELDALFHLAPLKASLGEESPMKDVDAGPEE